MLALSLFLILCVTQIKSSSKCYNIYCVDEVAGCAFNGESQCVINEAYLGVKNTTLDGKPCLNWNELGIPSLGHHDHNFCRNPDNSMGPWCMTADSWGFCFISCCPISEQANFTGSEYPKECVTAVEPKQSTCYDSQCIQQDESFALFGSQECTMAESYLGIKNTSASDLPCLPWNHSGLQNFFVQYLHSYCRNPDGSPVPWCFTAEGIRQPCFKNSTEKCSNCLDANHGPGCEDREIQACVCQTDRNCCEKDWDASCVSKASGCGCVDGEVSCDNCLDTAHGPGCNNEAIQSCVCANDPTCCTDDWDSKCVLSVTHSERCDVSCKLENCGDCLTARGDNSGCSNKRIESCVCQIDQYCCNVKWDEYCVEEVGMFEECSRSGCV